MQKKKSFAPVFLIFLSISLAIFFLARAGYLSGLSGVFESITLPIQSAIFKTSGQNKESEELKKLREENIKLASQIVKHKEDEREIQALRDQFQTTDPKSNNLLMAQVIGLASDKFIIDKGKSDGIKSGYTVVYKNNLIGRVSKVSSRVSAIELITSKNTSLTAKVLNSQTQGIIKGSENGIVLENVVLSEKLNKDELVVTEGNVREDGVGFPPDLVVGKIKSVNKKASDLFQSAEIESLVNFRKLESVFVIIE